MVKKEQNLIISGKESGKAIDSYLLFEDGNVVDLDMEKKAEKMKKDKIEKRINFAKKLREIVQGKKIMLDRFSLAIILTEEGGGEIRNSFVLDGDFFNASENIREIKEIGLRGALSSSMEAEIAKDISNRLFITEQQALHLVVAKREGCAVYLTTKIKENFCFFEIKIISVEMLV